LTGNRFKFPSSWFEYIFRKSLLYKCSWIMSKTRFRHIKQRPNLPFSSVYKFKVPLPLYSLIILIPMYNFPSYSLEVYTVPNFPIVDILLIDWRNALIPLSSPTQGFYQHLQTRTKPYCYSTFILEIWYLTLPSRSK
jgi:hypothetical protein